MLFARVRVGSKLTVDTALWALQVYPWKLTNLCSAANGEYVPSTEKRFKESLFRFAGLGAGAFDELRHSRQIGGKQPSMRLG